MLIKDGTYRIGESVILLEGQNRIVLQGHFYKIRVLDTEFLNPFFLYWALLKVHPNILSMSLTQSTLSSNTKDRIKKVSIPFPQKKKRNEIARNTEKIIRARNSYRNEFDKIRC
ncbi:MAG: restriction endonuclease subunit S [Rhodobacteraceae bacterium]|nr:restriction endonuclease subunit S [Paracoccaceae bacterium]MCY4250865.1 restriction endonuclease subunit S [Paracoccaceae bacterium]